MSKIRVLVVDDSVVMRKLVSDALTSDPEIEIAGVAANGKIALAKILLLKPDAVTLDIEMPEMDGLATLTELRKLYPTLPVIMCSSLTESGASSTIEALARGATDYVTKPSQGTPEASRAALIQALVPKIRAFAKPSATESTETPPACVPGMVRLGQPKVEKPAPPQITLRPRGAHTRIDVIAIGVSTGGPEALAKVFPGLPADLPVPIVIVQHMPPLFTRLLAERLSSTSKLRVVEGADGMELERGRAYIAPGDYHMLVRQSGTGVKLQLNQGPQENSCRPSVDPLFRSVAEVYGNRCLAVVLTGMGQDGKKGCEAIIQCGGQVIAQDEATSVVWGMPGAVAMAGLADMLAPIGQISAEISKRAREGRVS